MKNFLLLLLTALTIVSCKQHAIKGAKAVPVIGFADAFVDNTVGQAKTGFIDALQKNGFSEKDGTVKIIYRNAQGEQPKLLLSIKYFISEKVDIIATCPTTPTIAALQNTKTIPVCMMVAPTPALMKVNDAQGNPPKNLFGVADDLGYIDTSFLLIPQIIKPKSGKLNIGILFNQSEPQSVEAINRIKHLAETNNINLVILPVNSSADVQLVTASLLSKNVDAFFANPDNVVFASFETIVKNCDKAKVPIFTSEAGLVERGAVAAYGADIYQWGYQAGEAAAQFLKTKDSSAIKWQMVTVRKRVYNADAAKKYNLAIPTSFQPIH